MALMARRIVLLSLLQLVSAKVKSGATSSADLWVHLGSFCFAGAGQLSGTVHSFQNVTLLLYDEQTMVASRLEDTTSCSLLQNRSHTQSPLHATERGAAFRWRFVPQHTTPYPRWSVAVAACDASELSLTYELGFVNSAEPWWSAQLSCEASLALPLAFAYLLLMAPLAVLLLRSAWRERARHPEPPSDAADAPPPPPRHLPIASLGAAAACAAAAGALATVANLVVYARHGRGLRLLRFVAGVGDVGCEVALLALLVLLLDRLAHGAPPPSQPLAPEALLPLLAILAGAQCGLFLWAAGARIDAMITTWLTFGSAPGTLLLLIRIALAAAAFAAAREPLRLLTPARRGPLLAAGACALAWLLAPPLAAALAAALAPQSRLPFVAVPAILAHALPLAAIVFAERTALADGWLAALDEHDPVRLEIAHDPYERVDSL